MTSVPGAEMRKTLDFVNEIAGIMYVGGILSHIVIGAVLGSPDGQTALNVYTYKELSAYILILPGLALKLACDLTLFYGYGVRDHWMKIKLGAQVLLAINAFVFLVPMMPELRAMAAAAAASAPLPQAFHDLEATEALIGQTNVLPLLTELIIGAFKPKLFGERRM